MNRLSAKLVAAFLTIGTLGVGVKEYFDSSTPERTLSAEERQLLRSNIPPELRPRVATLFNRAADAYVIGVDRWQRTGRRLVSTNPDVFETFTIKDMATERVCRCSKFPTLCDTSDTSEWRLFGRGVGGVNPDGSPATCDPLSCENDPQTKTPYTDCGPHPYVGPSSDWPERVKKMPKEELLRRLAKAVRKAERDAELADTRAADRAVEQ